ncbi:MAG: IS200/IS605 family accessory protein TnpB-related protein [Betaproteobacteria bacterium]|nr:IS200/IS605 family accessory protein TnpB-related protein [Betaproteobacteria bacterium]
MPDAKTFTYQTRLEPDPAVDAALAAYAALFGRAERSLFAARQADGRDTNTLKRDFLQEFGLTARQYNAIKIGLDGKIDSIRKRRPDLILEAEARIGRAKKTIGKIEQRLQDLQDPLVAFKSGRAVKPMSESERRRAIAKAAHKLHQKKRRLKTREDRLGNLKNDHEAGAIRLCFGSKRLFRAQFDLVANGYVDGAQWDAASALLEESGRTRRQEELAAAGRDAWLVDWRAARSSQFLVLGSKDETAGCQGCVATRATDGSLTLRVRLPRCLLPPHGSHVEVPGVRFAYGHEKIVEALNASCRIEGLTKTGQPVMKRTGTAISYRFMRDGKGWRVFASLAVETATATTSKLAGALGIDINADHLAVTRIDRFGNWVDSVRFDVPTYGKSSEQVEAMMGDSVKEIAGIARTHGVPVVHERLDFGKKKSDLEGSNPRHARMLSSFAYGKALAMLDAACHRAGVEVLEVNPAYTSVIGAVNHAQPLGLSVHQAAAMAIARRGLGFAERLRQANKSAGGIYTMPLRRKKKSKTQTNSTPEGSEAKTSPEARAALSPCRDGGHVAFALPARNRAKPVWSQWSSIRSVMRAPHVARSRSGIPHTRIGVRRGEPAPLRPLEKQSPESLASGAHRGLPAQLRHASSQHCSGCDCGEDVPW